MKHHSPYLSGMSAGFLDDLIGVYPDYPKPGIIFRDVMPLVENADAFDRVMRAMCAPRNEVLATTHIAGIESRGFIFGAAMAAMLHIGFIPIRKLGSKFPGRLDQESYELEYGTATLVCQAGIVKPGDKVMVVDDLIATGGSALAAAKLIQRQGAEVSGFSFVIELAGLRGAERLGPNVHSLLTY